MNAALDLNPILLVEDSPSDEALTIRALKKHNVTNELVVARDGAEAVDYLFGSGEFAGRDPNHVPKLILLDLKLPKLSGLDVLLQLRRDERTRLVPVVVWTSSLEEEDVRAVYQGGGNSYIQKPVDFRQYSEALRQVADYWLTLNKTPSFLPGLRSA